MVEIRLRAAKCQNIGCIDADSCEVHDSSQLELGRLWPRRQRVALRPLRRRETIPQIERLPIPACFLRELASIKRFDSFSGHD